MKPETQPVIWAAFAMTQPLFAGIAWVNWPGADPDMALAAWVIAAMIAPISVLSVSGAGWLIRGEGEDRQRVRSLVRWASAESATLMGFVATFIGGPRWLAPAAAAWGLILLVLAYPSRND